MVLGVLAAGLFETAPVRAQSLPDCRNYVVATSWGRLTVDTRPSNDGDPIGIISWAWFIEVRADVPGRYDWTVYINGAAPEGPQWNVKDDNLHSAFRRYRDGVDRYASGDVFHVEAAHAGGRNLYVTPLNRCRIP
ncbi:hypothetical protein ACTD5D_11060 [Nocardia takedensis]|uniref:hypothetical protein n=1 Tax=Nocardia takedensis TaxID=259390 RepID=UPI0012F6DC56|nr:hypothetical protein [Nocardia takedensis]